MTDRHLRPDEIELLLDGEEGFGVRDSDSVQVHRGDLFGSHAPTGQTLPLAGLDASQVMTGDARATRAWVDARVQRGRAGTRERRRFLLVHADADAAFAGLFTRPPMAGALGRDRVHAIGWRSLTRD